MVFLIEGLVQPTMDFIVSKGSKSVFNTIQKIIDADELLKALQNEILAARSMVSQASTVLLGCQNQGELEQRVDELNRLCYEGEDLMEDVALKTKIGRALKGPEIDKLRAKLQKKSTQVTSVDKVGQAPHDDDTVAGQSNGLNRAILSLPVRQTEMEAIIQKLFSSPFGVSIIGVRRLGKTMLAVKVLQNVANRFCLLHAPAIVVEGSFNSSEMVHKLQQTLSELSGRNNRNNRPQQSLLIFIDNLVHVKSKDWHAFRSLLQSESIFGNDIKFLITSPNPRVQEVTRTSSYYLKPMSNEDCEIIIKDRALSSGEDLPPQVLSINARILAKKCRGFPGLAENLGFELQTCKRDKWTDELLNRDSWEIPVVRAEFFPDFKKSYSKMEPRLKQCLAYLSLFPSNYNFCMDGLIQLWTGEGFLPLLQGTSKMDTGKKYVGELLKRSILQLSDKKTDTGDPMYNLNAFSHKLCQLAAFRAFLLLDGDMPASYSKKSVRHLSMICENSVPKIWDEIIKIKGLRTFHALHGITQGQCPPNLFASLNQKLFKLIRLRVLALKGTDVAELPNSIDELTQLRYLDISGTRVQKLPQKFSKLVTLQFFKGTKKLLSLPKDFKNLTNLMCIDWEIGDIRRFNLPSNIGNLCYLQNLPLFQVKDGAGYSILELKNMNSLEGSICISQLEKVPTKEMAEAAKLCNKKHLKRIEFEWSSNLVNCDATLEGLQPHKHLKEVKITNGAFSAFPQWMCDPDRLLETIHLKGCRSDNRLPPLGLLTILTSLTIEGVDDLKQVCISFCGNSTAVHFNSLEKLVFKNLPQLQQWTAMGQTAMPKLHDLKIINCPELVSLPPLKTLTSLEDSLIEDCDKLESMPEVPTSVKSLIVMNSALLKNRCLPGGEDWRKICNISKVQIDDKMFYCSAASTSQAQAQAQNIDVQGYQTTTDKTGRSISRYLPKVLRSWFSKDQ